MLEHQDLRDLCKGFVSSAYVEQGTQELTTQNKLVKDLLSRRCMPDTGWSEQAIKRLLWVRAKLWPASALASAKHTLRAWQPVTQRIRASAHPQLQA